MVVKSEKNLKELSPSRVEVLNRERLLDDFFKVDRYTLQYELFGGGMGPVMKRLVFERGDAVAVLPYDPETGMVVLIKQFRCPAYVREGDGWLWETIAGMLDGQQPEDVVRREAMEEAHLTLDELEYVATVFPSGGACSERLFVYLAPISIESGWQCLGGLESESEDILVCSFPLDEAVRMMREGQMKTATVVIALQHLLLKRAGISC